jgi:hypothetical protein
MMERRTANIELSGRTGEEDWGIEPERDCPPGALLDWRSFRQYEAMLFQQNIEGENGLRVPLDDIHIAWVRMDEEQRSLSAVIEGTPLDELPEILIQPVAFAVHEGRLFMDENRFDYLTCEQRDWLMNTQVAAVLIADGIEPHELEPEPITSWLD